MPNHPIERERPPEVHPFLGRASVALDAAGITWALLGDTEGLLGAGHTGILIAPKDVQAAHRALAAAGFRRVGPAGPGGDPNGSAGSPTYSAYDRREDAFVQLRALTTRDVGRSLGFSTLLADAGLRGRERHGVVWRLTAEDEVWLYVLHLLLHAVPVSPEPPADLIPRVVGASARTPVLRAVERLVGGAAVDDLRTALRRSARGEGRTRTRSVVARWYASTGPSGRFTSRLHQLRSAHRLQRLLGALRRVAPREGRGMCVALLGPDGAGKTTLGKSLEASLPGLVRYLYSGLWQADDRCRLFQRSRTSRLALRLWSVARIGVAARLHRRKGRLVIFDRTPHEVRLSGRDAGLGTRLTALAVRILAATPDLVVLLDAPAEVLFARKGEHTVQILDRLRWSYAALLEHFPAHTVVDARTDADDVRRQVTEAIWRYWPTDVDPAATCRWSWSGQGRGR